MTTWTQPGLPSGFPGGAETAFVGRLHYLEELEEVWAAVRAGRPRTVIIGGEPGVGKTRLAAEVALALHADGATVLWGACHPDLDVPYRPFVTAIEHLLIDAEAGELAPLLSDSARHLLRLTPHLHRHRRDLEAPETDAAGSRLALFGAIEDLLVALGERRPVALMLEDLHWAATPTLQLVAHLVRSVTGTPLLVIATHRTTAPDRRDELTYTIAELYRNEGVSRIDLGGLGTAEVADYLVRMSGMSRDGALRSAAVLRDQTAGNPFFLHEVWRDLSSQGGLDQLSRAGCPAPSSVRDMLARRLAGLSTTDVEVIELGAVIGTVFELAVLLEASERPEDETLAAVDIGVGAGLLETDMASGRCRFVHALARQAVLDRVPPSRRVRMHARIAQVLDQRVDRDPRAVAELAHHYSRAQALGHADQAVEYLVRAAEHGERSFAYEEAAAMYTRAAEIPSARGPSREERQFAAAHSHLLAGDFAEARALYEQLARSADPEVVVRAAIGYEESSWRPGRHGERARQLLSLALRRWPNDPHDAVYVRALASMGRAHSFTGNDRRAEEVGERALGFARDHGDDELLAHALGATLWRGMTPELAPHLLDRALELAELERSLGELGPSAFYRSLFGYMLGKPEVWAEARRDQAHGTGAGGEPFFRYVAGCGEYACQFLRGDFVGAERTVAVLDELGDEFGPDTSEGSYAVQTFMLRRATGRLEVVRPLVTGNEDLDTTWLPGLLALYTELGMWDAAARVLGRMLDELEVHRSVASQWGAALAFMVDAVIGLEDENAAAQLYACVEEWAGLNLVAGQFVAVFGSGDRYLGSLESLLGEATAEHRFRSALAMDRRMGATVHQAETLAAWSDHAIRHGGTEGGRRAAQLRAEARALVDGLGYRRAGVALHRTGDRAPGHRDDRAGLTDRELEVLRAVARGLSNRQIGDRLYISQNTAANHVRSILMKLEVPNRTHAAMRAADLGLLDPSGRADRSRSSS